MSFVAVAVGVGSAAAGVIGSRKSSKAADKANKRAELMQARAQNTLSQRQGVTLDLPDLDLSDLRLEPEQTQVLGNITNAKTREEFTQALAEIGRSFFPTALQASAVDAANIRERLPDVFDISSQLSNQDAQIQSQALDVFAPGSSERRAATLRGLNSFLNFEVPTALENQLNRRTAEQAYRTGQTIGPTASRASERMTFDELRNNFFRAAQTGQAEQALNQPMVRNAGIQDALLPASSLQLELQNLEQRRQASLINLQNMISQRVANFQTTISERESNLARQDQLAINQANLLLGQSNAQTQRANAESANAATQLQQGFSALGSALGQAGAFAKSLTPNPSGLTGFNVNPSTGARTFNNVPVVNAKVV